MKKHQLRGVLEQHKFNLENYLSSEDAPYDDEMNFTKSQYDDMVKNVRKSTEENLKKVIFDLSNLPESF